MLLSNLTCKLEFNVEIPVNWVSGLHRNQLEPSIMLLLIKKLRNRNVHLKENNKSCLSQNNSYHAHPVISIESIPVVALENNLVHILPHLASRNKNEI